MRNFLTICLVTILAICVNAQLQNALEQSPVSLDNLAIYKRAVALDLLQQLNDEQLRERLQASFSERGASVSLVNFLEKNASRNSMAFLKNIAKLDKDIRDLKGIADRVDNLWNVRLAFPEKGFAGSDFLVSFIPSGNEHSWKHIEAFDLAGNVHYLDVYKTPDVQVLVVGLDAQKDMKAGLELLNEKLSQAGMQVTTEPTRAGLAVAKLNYIRLEDDKEPWISGDAEIYALVNGIAPEASKANILAVEMPYLITDEKDYYPNQVLIIWDNYRYKAANINLYEHDDNTNYKEIAAMLIEKIGIIVPEYQMIFDIASQIIRLMPDSWFSNDDDYVDVYYTLEMGKTYTKLKGVSTNATVTLVPYTIAE